MSKLSGPMMPPQDGGPPRQAVLLLHGYGSDGRDLIGLAPHWRDLLPGALFVAPNGPEPCGEFAGGYQWFDIDCQRTGWAEGAARAQPILIELLRDLWAQTGLTAAETVLAGFSQGAMMALNVGLALPEPPRGIIAFSGALIPPPGFAEGQGGLPPVCLVHGEADSVVDAVLSIEAAQTLRARGAEVSLLVEPGVEHTITPAGLAFASAFLDGLALA